jgi:RHS repeat-associated protein
VTDPVLSDTVSGATTNYTPGISERRTGTSRFLHSGIKNADSRTTTGTSIEASRQYDAFGNVTSSNGTWQGMFGYAGGYGYQEDSVTGLKLLGHRYYDSATGSFISKDPAKSGRNWYGYCSNNPITFTDPSGLQDFPAPSGPPPMDPGPGNSWKWVENKNHTNRNSRSRPGFWKLEKSKKGGKGGQRRVSWDPKYGHWDDNDGEGKRTRVSREGKVLPPDKAHNEKLGMWDKVKNFFRRIPKLPMGGPPPSIPILIVPIDFLEEGMNRDLNGDGMIGRRSVIIG